MARCDRLGAISDEPRPADAQLPFAGDAARQRAGRLVDASTRASTSARTPPSTCSGRWPSPTRAAQDAAPRLASRHGARRGQVRRAARRARGARRSQPPSRVGCGAAVSCRGRRLQRRGRPAAIRRRTSVAARSRARSRTRISRASKNGVLDAPDGGRASSSATSRRTSSRDPSSRRAICRWVSSARLPAPIAFASRPMAPPGHAGTTPMTMRHDALCGAAELVLAAERCGVVATVGQMEVEPGASNVIPGRVVAHARRAARRRRAPRARGSAPRSRGAGRSGHDVGLRLVWTPVQRSRGGPL